MSGWQCHVNHDPLAYEVQVYLRRQVEPGFGEYAVFTDGDVIVRRVAEGAEGPAFMRLTFDESDLLTALAVGLQDMTSNDDALQAVTDELRDALRYERARVDRLLGGSA